MELFLASFTCISEESRLYGMKGEAMGILPWRRDNKEKQMIIREKYSNTLPLYSGFEAALCLAFTEIK